MADYQSDPKISLPQRSLKVEVAVVFLVQLFLVTSLVRLDQLFSLGGNLHTLVGVLFILLPIIVLDRRDRPYDRYGIRVGKPHIDLLWVLGIAAVTFPIVALGAPTVWGIEKATWSFAWPERYPGMALLQILVVALPEEFFYRGYILGRLNDIFTSRINLLGVKVGFGFILQAVLFALGHYLIDFHPGRLAVFFPALVFGWLRLKRGTIVAPVLFLASSNIFMEIFRAGYGLG
ncbi:MAG: CPBP family intramembrane metalloprotease [Proteobacteria bacterium]|nr:CPBP family intramembrane metalloprotease [Pseudomonadota bacterium]